MSSGRVIHAMKRTHYFYRWLAPSFIALLFAGCAALPQLTPEEQVGARAQEWLERLMAFDMEGAYEFTSPAYRSAHGLRHYAKAYAGKDMWRSAEITRVECNVDGEFGECIVTLTVTYRGFAMETDMTTELPQQWVLVDDAWFTVVSD